MRVSAFRWVAVPLVVVASYYSAFFLFLEFALSCLHIGVRPAGLCSDWWYGNHSWVGAATLGVALFFGPVLLSVVLAPRFKGVVGLVAFGVVVVHTIAEFDFWVWSVAIPIVAVASALAGFTFRHRVFRTDHVA